MKKRIIKLTESDLRIISEQGISNSDKQIINGLIKSNGCEDKN